MKISIIVPVYNEEKFISLCLDHLCRQVYPKKDYEIIVVNDGSIDKTLKVLKNYQKIAQRKKVELRVFSLRNNQGRIIARETGAKKAKYKNLFFIDSRCLAQNNLLKKLTEINYQPLLANILINTQRSSLDRFNYLFRKRLYAPYFGQKFAPIYIDKNNFNKIPRGVGAFFCSKDLFFDAMVDKKTKEASDDPRLLWNLVNRKNILKHPDVVVTYLSRLSFKKTIEQLIYRGTIFVDFYFSPKKFRFWIFIFLPITSILLTCILFLAGYKLFLTWIVFLIMSWVIISSWLSETITDFFTCLKYTLFYSLFFSLGIFRGLFFKIWKRS